MKRFFVITATALIMLLSGCGSNTDNPAAGYPQKGNWQLVWEENFDGNAVNEEEWSITEQGLNWNNEDQAYTAKNVSVEDGKLVLTCKKEHWEGRSGRVDVPDQTVEQEYTSGEVNTRNSWTYGRFEIRAKLPRMKGILSAHWMVPSDGDWPPGIDIMQMLGDDSKTVWFANHYGTAAKPKVKEGKYTGREDFSSDFHVFAVEWEPGVLRWYVDGARQFESTAQVPAEPFYLRLSLPVGPDRVGNPPGDAVFPQRQEVDWVKVYQRK